MTVFGAILKGRQSGQKLQCLYGNPKANSLIEFYAIMNRNIKILTRRLYSPSLKDVAWPERAQLIFLIFHTFVSKFSRVEGAAREKNYSPTNVWKIRQINWASSFQPTFFKLVECNLLLSILTLRSINCVKFSFGKSYLTSDSHTNTVNSDHFAYPSRWPKTVIRPIIWKVHHCSLSKMETNKRKLMVIAEIAMFFLFLIKWLPPGCLIVFGNVCP